MRACIAGSLLSDYGGVGEDVTGDAFRYGVQVDPCGCGVWKHALPPGQPGDGTERPASH
jgi:hypothetical protein